MTCDAPNTGHEPCRQCGQYHVLVREYGKPAESALDPFERIELLAAAWRNAYRALERGDATATDAHAREATGHFIALLQRLA